MNRDQLVEALPHYVAVLLLMLLVIGVVRTVAGDLGFWIEIAILFAIAFGYSSAVRRFGMAPELWE